MTEPVPDTTEGPTFMVRAGIDGEALVTAPDGRMEFMGVWKFFLFCIAALRQNRNTKIKVQDDKA